MASQAAPSISATMQGVAYTSRLPEPTSAAVSSRSTRVETSAFIPTVISIIDPPIFFFNIAHEEKYVNKGIEIFEGVRYNKYKFIERGVLL